LETVGSFDDMDGVRQVLAQSLMMKLGKLPDTEIYFFERGRAVPVRWNAWLMPWTISKLQGTSAVSCLRSRTINGGRLRNVPAINPVQSPDVFSGQKEGSVCKRSLLDQRYNGL